MQSTTVSLSLFKRGLLMSLAILLVTAVPPSSAALVTFNPSTAVDLVSYIGTTVCSGISAGDDVLVNLAVGTYTTTTLGSAADIDCTNNAQSFTLRGSSSTGTIVTSTGTRTASYFTAQSASGGRKIDVIIEDLTISAVNMNNAVMIRVRADNAAGSPTYGASLTLDNVIVQNCAVVTTSGGGLIRVDNVANPARFFLSVTNCRFSGNTASTGVVNVLESTAVFDNVIFENTKQYASGTVMGCAIFSASSATVPMILTVTDSIFDKNTGTAGGAIYSQAVEMNMTLSNSNFTDNLAIPATSTIIKNRGGAIMATEGTALGTYNIAGCRFTGNTVIGPLVSSDEYYGGALVFEKTSTTNIGTAFVTGCTFAENSVNGFGGDIYVKSGSIEIDSCNFGGSSAALSGGSVAAGSVSTIDTYASLTNSNFTGTYSSTSGGLVHFLTIFDVTFEGIRFAGTATDGLPEAYLTLIGASNVSARYLDTSGSPFSDVALFSLQLLEDDALVDFGYLTLAGGPSRATSFEFASGDFVFVFHDSIFDGVRLYLNDLELSTQTYTNITMKNIESNYAIEATFQNVSISFSRIHFIDCYGGMNFSLPDPNDILTSAITSIFSISNCSFSNVGAPGYSVLSLVGTSALFIFENLTFDSCSADPITNIVAPIIGSEAGQRASDQTIFLTNVTVSDCDGSLFNDRSEELARLTLSVPSLIITTLNSVWIEGCTGSSGAFASLSATQVDLSNFYVRDSSDGGGAKVTFSNWVNVNDGAFTGNAGGTGLEVVSVALLNPGYFESNPVDSVEVTVTNIEVSDNGGGSNGAGLSVIVAMKVPTTLTFSSMQVNGNSAQSGNRAGGGVSLTSSFPFNVSVENLTAEGNDASDGSGGGLLVSMSSATNVSSHVNITNVVCESNSALEGGGLYVGGADNVHMEGVIMTANTGGDVGGAMLQSVGHVIVTLSSFSFNLMTNLESNIGGGGLSINIPSSVSVTRCIFNDNVSLRHGGGLYVEAGLITAPIIMTDLELTNNWCRSMGGALMLVGRSFTSVSDCTMTLNTASFGAVVMFDKYLTSIESFLSVLELENSQLVNNSGVTSAGLVGFNANVNVVNTTVSGDSTALFFFLAAVNIESSLLYSSSDSPLDVFGFGGSWLAVRSSVVRGFLDAYIFVNTLFSDSFLVVPNTAVDMFAVRCNADITLDSSMVCGAWNRTAIKYVSEDTCSVSGVGYPDRAPYDCGMLCRSQEFCVHNVEGPNAVAYETLGCPICGSPCDYGQPNICAETAVCVNQGANDYYCECPIGTSGDATVECIDINECVVNNIQCQNYATCKNFYGGYTCECWEGTEFNAVTQTCDDVDECVVDAPCPANITTCTNIFPVENGTAGFYCECSDDTLTYQSATRTCDACESVPGRVVVLSVSSTGEAVEKCVCAIGWYGPIDLNGDAEYCTQCQGNATTSDVGSVSFDACVCLPRFVAENDSCTECPPGTFDSTYGGPVVQCSPCLIDTYKPTYGYEACLTCHNSTTTAYLDGQTECVCKSNYYPITDSSDGELQCQINCYPGGFLPNPTLCVDCIGDTYSTTTNATECSPCGNSQMSNSGHDACVCPTGSTFSYYENGTLSCSLAWTNQTFECECELGTLRCNDSDLDPNTNFGYACSGVHVVPQGEVDCSGYSPKNLTCVANCPPGTMYTVQFDYCTPCAPGFYQTQEDSDECVACPLYSSTNRTGCTSPSDCICAVNFTMVDGECLIDCPPGMQRTLLPLGQSFCGECGEGTYSEAMNAEDCTNCAAGAITIPAKQATLPENCGCRVGEYSEVPMGPCFRCPTGAECPGFHSPPSALPGYYQGESGAFVECAPSDSCMGGNSCAEGYEGDRCSVCRDDFYRLAGRCVKCNGSRVVVLVAVILGLFAFSSVIVVLNARESAKSRFVVILIGLNSLQMVAQFGQLTIELPRAAGTVYNIFSVLNFNVEVLGVECYVATEQPFLLQFALKMLLPVVIGLGLSVVALVFVILERSIGYVLREGKANYPFFIFGVLYRSFIHALLVIYLPLAASVLDYFDCFKTGDGGRAVRSAPDMSCDDPAYKAGLIVAIVLVFLYVLGIPAAFAGVLAWYKRTLSEVDFFTSLGTLVGKYRPETYGYEVLILLRKFAVVLALSVGWLSKAANAGAAAMVLYIFLMIHIAIKPYDHRAHNWIESMCMFSTVVVLLGGLVFFEDWAQAAYNGVTIFLVSTSAIVVVIGVIYDFYVESRLVKETTQETVVYNNPDEAAHLHTVQGSKVVESMIVDSMYDSVGGDAYGSTYAFASMGGVGHLDPHHGGGQAALVFGGPSHGGGVGGQGSSGSGPTMAMDVSEAAAKPGGDRGRPPVKPRTPSSAAEFASMSDLMTRMPGDPRLVAAGARASTGMAIGASAATSESEEGDTVGELATRRGGPVGGGGGGQVAFMETRRESFQANPAFLGHENPAYLETAGFGPISGEGLETVRPSYGGAASALANAGTVTNFNVYDESGSGGGRSPRTGAERPAVTPRRRPSFDVAGGAAVPSDLNTRASYGDYGMGPMNTALPSSFTAHSDTEESDGGDGAGTVAAHTQPSFVPSLTLPPQQQAPGNKAHAKGLRRPSMEGPPSESPYAGNIDLASRVGTFDYAAPDSSPRAAATGGAPNKPTVTPRRTGQGSSSLPPLRE